MAHFENFFKNPINIERDPAEHTPELEALRKERDEHTKKACEIQKKIDDIIISTAMESMSDLIGEYVKITSKSLDEEYFMKVKEVERQYNGVRLHGPKLDVYCDPKSKEVIGRIDSNGSIIIKKENFDSVVKITADDFNYNWDTFINTFDNSLE